MTYEEICRKGISLTPDYVKQALRVSFSDLSQLLKGNRTQVNVLPWACQKLNIDPKLLNQPLLITAELARELIGRDQLTIGDVFLNAEELEQKLLAYQARRKEKMLSNGLTPEELPAILKDIALNFFSQNPEQKDLATVALTDLLQYAYNTPLRDQERHIPNFSYIPNIHQMTNGSELVAFQPHIDHKYDLYEALDQLHTWKKVRNNMLVSTQRHATDRPGYKTMMGNYDAHEQKIYTNIINTLEPVINSAKLTFDADTQIWDNSLEIQDNIYGKLIGINNLSNQQITQKQQLLVAMTELFAQQSQNPAMADQIQATIAEAQAQFELIVAPNKLAMERVTAQRTTTARTNSTARTAKN